MGDEMGHDLGRGFGLLVFYRSCSFALSSTIKNPERERERERIKEENGLEHRNRERGQKQKGIKTMESGTGVVSGTEGGIHDDLSSTSSPSSTISDWSSGVSRKFQYLLDKSTPFVLKRWIGFATIATIYIIRVVFIEGFYIVSYGLGIYILNLLIAFLSPQVDPEIQGPTLPTRGSDEFRPFVRRLPEFKFWYSMTKAFCIAFVMTFFSVFDVPVFWPILFFYWMVLFFVTMKKQILHMIKYKYIPFSLGKQRYTGKRAASTEDIPS